MDGCKIIHFNAPLYYVNVDYFLEKVGELAGLRAVKQSAISKKMQKQQQKSVPVNPDVSSFVESDHSSHSHAFHLPDFESLSMSHIAAHFHRHHGHRDPAGGPTTTTPTKITTALAEGPLPDVAVGLGRPDKNGGAAVACVDAATWTGDDFDQQPIRHLIVMCSSMSFVDVNGVKALKDLAERCAAANMTLFLAACKAEMEEMLALCGYTSHLTPDHIFVHVHDAVMQAVQEHQQVRAGARLALNGAEFFTSGGRYFLIFSTGDEKLVLKGECIEFLPKPGCRGGAPSPKRATE